MHNCETCYRNTLEKVKELSKTSAILVLLFQKYWRTLLSEFACMEAANGTIRRKPFSLSLSPLADIFHLWAHGSQISLINSSQHEA